MNRLYIVVMLGIIVLVAATAYGIVALRARELRRDKLVQKRLDEKNKNLTPREDTKFHGLKDPR